MRKALVLGALALGVAACSTPEVAVPPTVAPTTMAAPRCSASATVFAAALADPSQLVLAGASADRLARFQREVDELRLQVPAELRADYDTFAAAYVKAVTAISSRGPDASRVQEALAMVDDSAVKGAHDKVRAYFESCL